MTLGFHLSSLLGSVSPSVSVSASMSASVSVSFLVLARWGEGPSAQGAGVDSLRQQGVKPRRAKSQQPLDIATLQDTFRVLTGTHNDICAEVGS